MFYWPVTAETVYYQVICRTIYSVNVDLDLSRTSVNLNKTSETAYLSQGSLPDLQHYKESKWIPGSARFSGSAPKYIGFLLGSNPTPPKNVLEIGSVFLQ